MALSEIINLRSSLVSIVLAGTILTLAVSLNASSTPDLDSAKRKERPPVEESAKNSKVAEQSEQAPQQTVVKPQPTQGQAKATDAEATASQKTSSEWWVVYLTGALVIVGACQIIAMGVQAYWMQRTLTVTKQSADAATATVNAMQDTAERELRAYVLPVSAERFRDEAGVVVIQLKIKNSGQTPAYKCRNGMVEAIYNGFPAPPEAFNKAPSPVGSTVMAPGELIEFFVEAKTISPQDEITIANKKMAIYLFGEIAYTDAFNKERTTKYRLVCTGEWLRTGRFAPSEQGNEAT